MRKARLIVMACVLALSGTAASADSSRRAERLEALASGIERALLDLAGALPVEAVFRDHGSGLVSLSVPLSPEQRKHFERLAAKPLRTLAAGRSTARSSDPSTVTDAVLSSLGTDYFLWWAALNTTENQTLERKTTLTVTGPGDKFSHSETVEYGPAALHLFALEDRYAPTAAGTYKQRVKITKGGSVKTFFEAQ